MEPRASPRVSRHPLHSTPANALLDSQVRHFISLLLLSRARLELWIDFGDTHPRWGKLVMGWGASDWCVEKVREETVAVHAVGTGLHSYEEWRKDGSVNTIQITITNIQTRTGNYLFFVVFYGFFLAYPSAKAIQSCSEITLPLWNVKVGCCQEDILGGFPLSSQACLLPLNLLFSWTTSLQLTPTLVRSAVENSCDKKRDCRTTWNWTLLVPMSTSPKLCESGEEYLYNNNISAVTSDFFFIVQEHWGMLSLPYKQPEKWPALSPKPSDSVFCFFFTTWLVALIA